MHAIKPLCWKIREDIFCCVVRVVEVEAARLQNETLVESGTTAMCHVVEFSGIFRGGAGCWQVVGYPVFFWRGKIVTWRSTH